MAEEPGQIQMAHRYEESSRIGSGLHSNGSCTAQRRLVRPLHCALVVPDQKRCNKSSHSLTARGLLPTTVTSTSLVNTQNTIGRTLSPEF